MPPVMSRFCRKCSITISTAWTIQRQFFDPFTIPAAAPGSNPDGDGFSNPEEALMNADLTDLASRPVSTVSPFEILVVFIDAKGSTVTFESVTDTRYQLLSKQDLAGGFWQPVGQPVMAAGAATTVLDPSAKENSEFYSVETVP